MTTEEQVTGERANRRGDPHWRPKMLCLDLDGTLLAWLEGSGQDNERVRAPVKEAIARALQAGAHVVLASGRSPHAMTRVAELLDLPDLTRQVHGDRIWVVAANGAVVFRYPPVDVVHEETFNAAPAVEAVLAHHPNARVAVEARGRGYLVNRPFSQGELAGRQHIRSLSQLVSTPVSRVIIRDPGATPEDFIELTDRLGLQGTEYVVGWTAWLDLAPAGVSKASGVQYVADRLGISPDDALAIGDGRNDLEMFGWAGRSVAMGQAVDVVREAADFVTGPVFEDGAAVEIDRWFR